MGGCLSKKKRGENKVGDLFQQDETIEEDHHSHRYSSESSVKHLTRHHRLKRFEPGDKFGLAGAYEFERKIATGGTGEVWLCRAAVPEVGGGRLHVSSDVAIKLQQRPIRSDSVPMGINEALVASQLRSPHLMSASALVLSQSHVGLVMEYAEKGNLAEHVASRVPIAEKTGLVLSEEEARFVFRQIIDAVDFMHRNHTAHRDIKLDNILICMDKSPRAEKKDIRILLTDFQFAYHWGSSNHYAKYRGLLGTPVYMAPELLALRFDNKNHQNNYDPALADIWACGIVLVAMLVGGFPYDTPINMPAVKIEENIFELQEGQAWAESKYVKPHIGSLSDECIQLIDGILEFDPLKRLSLARIKRHSWLNKAFEIDEQELLEDLNKRQAELDRQIEEIPANMLEKRNKFVKKIFQVAASDPVDSSHDCLRDEFLDKDLAAVVDHHSIQNGGIIVSLVLEDLQERAEKPLRKTTDENEVPNSPPVGEDDSP
eukprot:jgi/Picsp_1/5871/NSC_03229-R1_kinase-like protein